MLACKLTMEVNGVRSFSSLVVRNFLPDDTQSFILGVARDVGNGVICHK
jgi:nitrogen fixation protein FixH